MAKRSDNVRYFRRLMVGYDGSPGQVGIDATYLTLSHDPDLTKERLFVPGANLSAVDGGANGSYTLNASATSAAVFQIYVKVIGASPYTIPAGNVFLMASASAGADFTALLPAATGSGAMVVVKRMDSNAAHTIVVTPNGTDTIDGVNASDNLSRQYVAINYLDYVAGGWVRW